MKNLYFLTALALTCAAAQAQTSFGNVEYPAPNSAGTGGGSGNSYFGHNAGDNNTADQNTFLGAYSGFSNTAGDFNTFVGSNSGYVNVSGANNVFLGYQTGRNNSGSTNTFLGMRSGYSSGSGSGNVFLGYQAGYNETGSDKLYIANSNTASPLIWGDFTVGSEKVNFNGSVGIGTPSPETRLHIVSGGQSMRLLTGSNTSGYRLDVGVNDNGVNFSNNSASRGFNFSNSYGNLMSITPNGNVGIGANNPNVKLQVGSHNFFKNGSWAAPVTPNAVSQGERISFYEGGGWKTAIGMAVDNGIWIQAHGGNTMHGFEVFTGGIAGAPTSKFVVLGDGNVGIGTTNPGYKLHVNGDAGKPGGGFWSAASDRRLKQDISPFTDGLEKIKQIKPVWYRYNGLAEMPTEERYVGIIAQEMQEVAPYTIGTFTYTDKEGNTTDYLDYDGSAVTYMLINAVKEQQGQLEAQSQRETARQARIDVLEQQLTALQQQLETLKTTVYGSPAKTPNTSGKTSAEQSLPEGFALYQNVPNPFDRTTVIGARVPESVQQAKIVVYNLQGLELASYPLSERGKVSVEISGGRFPAGMYLYALLADGQVIDTKKMILTD